MHLLFFIVILALLLHVAAPQQTFARSQQTFYSSDIKMLTGEMDVYTLQLTQCGEKSFTAVNFTVNEPLIYPYSYNTAALYISKGPATSGGYTPWPDQSTPSSYQYTTNSVTDPLPLPYVVVPANPGDWLYISVFCYQAPCEYNINAQTVNMKSSEIEALIKPATNAVYKKMPTKYTMKVLNLYPSNSAVSLTSNYHVNGPTVNLTICKDAIVQAFSNNAAIKNICLYSNVMTNVPGDLVFQLISDSPSTIKPLRWQTRFPQTLPGDLSGETAAPVSTFLSCPIPVSTEALPDELYITVQSMGAIGKNPWPTQYVVNTQWLPCTNTRGC